MASLIFQRLSLLSGMRKDRPITRALDPRIHVSVRQMSITNAHNCLFCVQPAAFLINKLLLAYSRIHLS